jgi:hypothetical protein
MKATKRRTLQAQADPGATGVTSMTGLTAGTSPAPADPIPGRQLEKAVSWTGGERFRCLWYRLRLTVQEMNCATRRTIELQAPWISDDRTS